MGIVDISKTASKVKEMNIPKIVIPVVLTVSLVLLGIAVSFKRFSRPTALVPDIRTILKKDSLKYITTNNTMKMTTARHFKSIEGLITMRKTTTKKPWNKKWKAPELYNCKTAGKSNKFLYKERLVHLDLKGAPPKISYYRKIFPLLKEMGATGLLIEYEDMFPYKGPLKVLARSTAYSESEVKEMLRLARESGLNTIIPLVQTFGHMEFVLKHSQFAELRENPRQENAISPSHNRTMSVLKEMIRQVARFHSADRYFHIGSDEVYGMGNYRSAQFMRSKSFSSTDLLIWHVKRVASVVMDIGHRPLMWDDMFRGTSVQLLKASGLGSMVDLVVWKYTPHPEIDLSPSWWKKYEQVFTNVWVASGFKGADHQTTYIVRMRDRLLNHLNWLKLMMKYGQIGGGKMVMRGTILTGWQRFQHHLPLCELLPVGLPSLGLCLQTLYHGCFSKKSHEYISIDVLRCDRPIAIDLSTEHREPSRCNFPGHEIYEAVQSLFCKGSNKCNKKLIRPLSSQVESIKSHMLEIFYQDTVNEWAKAHLG